MRGERDLSLAVADKICEVLGVQFTELAGAPRKSAPAVPPADDLEQQAAAGPAAKKRPGQPHVAPADFETGKKRRKRKGE
jgi:hypothetical protein